MPQGNYSALDRAIHRLAFSSPMLQLTAADMERALFSRRLQNIPVEKPIFITSLPRAGTTLLLEIISQVPDFASHRYRDMPFVLAPIFWDMLSKGFRREAIPRERAHGDGVHISYDSPEAFEEVIWRAFWPEKFKDKTLALWSARERRHDFDKFFREHIQKIIAVRSGDQGQRRRYVSKNNSNIARVAYLRRMFADCLIVVPFREPIEQARSLLRQHLRFSALHARDSFSKRYMRDIGHLEFGELHRPIEFGGIQDIRDRFQPAALEYWLGYWVVVFSNIIRHKDDLVLVSYDRVCRGDETSLLTLGERLEINGPGLLDAARKLLRSPHHYDTTDEVLDRSLLDRTHALHEQLLHSSVV
jgi:hypothetical protein